MLWYHFLAQQGYVVWICDNRSASEGPSQCRRVFKRLGEQDSGPIGRPGMAGPEALVDLSRVALEGWSYGGFMTAYSMTHSDKYKIGLAGAPVTDWRLYDSIYTERYMGLPSENAAGYDANLGLEGGPESAWQTAAVPRDTGRQRAPSEHHPIPGCPAEGRVHRGYGAAARLRTWSQRPQHVYARMQAMWEFIQKNL